MTIRHLEMTDPELRTCRCGAEHEVYAILAMDGTGVMRIAEIRMCRRCGPAWICLIGRCTAVLPVDGDLAVEHVREWHAL